MGHVAPVRPELEDAWAIAVVAGMLLGDASRHVATDRRRRFVP